MYGGVIGAPSLFYAPPPGALTQSNSQVKGTHVTLHTLSLCVSVSQSVNTYSLGNIIVF